MASCNNRVSSLSQPQRLAKPIEHSLLSHVDLAALAHHDVRIDADRTLCVCPFHISTSAEASMQIDHVTGHYRCVECGFNTTAIGWLMFVRGYDYAEAIVALAALTGTALGTYPVQSELQRARQRRYQALTRFAQLTQRKLRSSPDACQYVHNRGVSSKTMDRYGLGWVSHTTLAPERMSPVKRQRMMQYGLLQRVGAHRYQARLASRLTFPIRSTDGCVVGFGARTLGGSRIKYINSPASPSFDKRQLLYGLHEALDGRSTVSRLVLVEGYLDVLALSEAHVPLGVAAMGTGVSEEQLAHVFAYTPHLSVCFDGDEAGQRAAERVAELALTVVTDSERLDFVFLPSGHDPCSMLQHEGPGALRGHLAHTQSMEQVLHRRFSKGCDLTQIGGLARYAAEVKQALRRTRSAHLQARLQSQAERLIGVSLDSPGRMNLSIAA